ncbi:MAG: MDR/zinc-dependent alcohol dehydrogenase-like family protein [Steroidobacter sp.]
MTPNSQDQQRAAALVQPMRSQIVMTSVPQPGRDQVRVRLEGCGICASNLPVWEGRPWFQYPAAAGSPGHEGWGVVDTIGAGVNDVGIGERVAVLSGNAYAEYDVAPRSAVVRLPREFAGLPFPGEPLGCAMNIFERSDIRPGHRVAIVGAGFLGVLLTQLATKAGAQVVVISRRAYALDQARKMGAVCTVQSDNEHEARERALSITEGRGYDRVIEAAGLQSTLDLASAIAAEYGRLVIAGYHQDGLRQVNMQQWNWRALDVVNAHERSADRYAAGMQRAVDAVLDGRMDPFPLFTHDVALESLDHGFELTRTRPDGFMKALARVGAH